MPVALVLTGSHPRRVPLVADPFRLGRGPDAEFVLDDERAASLHAAIRLKRGEYMLSGTGGESVYVNGQRVPFMSLKHGDRIHFVEPALGDASVLRFEDVLGGAFVPPGESIAAAWMAHASFRDPHNGPDRYGKGTPLGGRNPGRGRIVREPGTARRLVVKTVGPIRSPAEGDGHLALLAALAGAPHPSVVPVVDGGLAAGPDGPIRWIAHVWVEGVTLRELLAERVPLEPGRALRVLSDLASAITHLHARGVIHRDVTPANAVVAPSGRAILIDPGQALLASEARPIGNGVVGTPGYLPPEAVLGGPKPLTLAADVYGLAATGYALFTGRPPAAGQDVLEALAQAAAPPIRPRDLGVELPPPLEATLLEALAAEPRARPTARRFEKSLAFARASLGLGDHL